MTLVVWMRMSPTRDLEAEEPGHDGYASGGGAQAAKLNLQGVFQKFDGKPSALPGAWPIRGTRSATARVCASGKLMAD